MQTLAIFGAGPALGLAVARRFGREGFRVALVARDPDRLDGLVRTLAGADVEAAAFPADLADRAAALTAAEAIQARFGPIDVLEYSPAGSGDSLRRPPSQIDPDTLQPLLDKFLLTPVALAGQLLPGMLERGDGGLLFAMGAAAKYPVPALASAGAALAGLRNYVHTLHAELAPGHVYAGSLVIGTLIEGSVAHRNASAWNVTGRPPVVVSPDDLAGRLWDMYARRDRVEDEVR
jgi:NADP-dependent 3-hydroxy acid dehydrogenase YdfG